MIRLIAETWVALNGVGKAMTFRPDWDTHFDMSLAGMWRSFFAVIAALPAAFFILSAAQSIGLTIDTARYFTQFAASWILFPVTAAVTVRLLGVPQNFVPWIVVHNWASLGLYGVMTVIWALNTAGLGGRDLFELLIFLYFYLRILVHWRAAYLTLGVPTITSAFAAAIPMLVQALAFRMISIAFETPDPTAD